MLDEAQLVAATSSVAAQMTSSLWRRHAWVVTGTPITTRLDEIQVSEYLWSVQRPLLFVSMYMLWWAPYLAPAST